MAAVRREKPTPELAINDPQSGILIETAPRTPRIG